MNDLTLVCASKIEAYASTFLFAMESLAHQLEAPFIIGADGEDAYRRARPQFHSLYTRVVKVVSKGYLESIHDEIVSHCETKFVLRLDDDEKASPAMIRWLSERAYRVSDHWKFARANLWTSTQYIKAAPLWPDHQTRLSVREKATGRTAIHCGSPFGGGTAAPVAIEHYKFVVKTREERQAIADRYDEVQKGLGSGGMLAFNLPELVYKELVLEPWGDGTVG